MPAARREPVLSVVVLAYDEEAVLERVVEEFIERLEGLRLDFELIVVDDGSMDRTGDIARAMADRHDCVRAVSHGGNEGLSAAALSGYLAARGEYVLWVEGDGQFAAADLAGFAAAIAESDVVTSVRDRREYPVLRRWVSRAYNLLLNSLFGLGVRDAGSAIMIRRKALEGLRPRSRSVVASAEMLLYCRGRRLRFAECRRSYVPREHGRSRIFSLGEMARAAADVWRLYLARR